LPASVALWTEYSACYRSPVPQQRRHRPGHQPGAAHIDRHHPVPGLDLDLLEGLAADSGGEYQLSSSTAGLVAGDRVRFQGGVDTNFITFCFGPLAGLLVNETWSFDPSCDVGADPITVLCDPNNDHSGGEYIKLDGSSMGSGVGSGLHINAVDGPVNQFAFVIMSMDGSATTPVFGGILCLANPAGRYNPTAATNQGLPQLNSLCMFDTNGDLQNLAGTATSTGGTGFDVPLELPLTPIGQVIAPSDVVYFQVWSRDTGGPPGETAAFSNMIEVTF